MEINFSFKILCLIESKVFDKSRRAAVMILLLSVASRIDSVPYKMVSIVD